MTGYFHTTACTYVAFLIQSTCTCTHILNTKYMYVYTHSLVNRLHFTYIYNPIIIFSHFQHNTKIPKYFMTRTSRFYFICDNFFEYISRYKPLRIISFMFRNPRPEFIILIKHQNSFSSLYTNFILIYTFKILIKEKLFQYYYSNYKHKFCNIKPTLMQIKTPHIYFRNFERLFFSLLKTSSDVR